MPEIESPVASPVNATASDLTLRPAWTFSIIIGSLTLSPIVLLALSKGFHWQRNLITPILGLFLIWAALSFWVESARIRIKDGVLYYSSAIVYRRSIKLADIARVKFESGWSTYADRARPFVRLAITPTPESGAKRFDIGIKPFKWSDIQLLLQTLGQVPDGREPTHFAKNKPKPAKRRNRGEE